MLRDEPSHEARAQPLLPDVAGGGASAWPPPRASAEGAYSAASSLNSISGGVPPGQRSAERRGLTVTSSDSAFWQHELSYSSLDSSESGYTQQPWLPDEIAAHCMICRRPFHLLRWTHHCRDCGGLFCRDCSSHRVLMQSTSRDRGTHEQALRVCDRCGFSPAYPLHLGCENPFACPRCHLPTSATQLLEYLRFGLTVALCCFCCGPQWCCLDWIVAREDAKIPPPRLESSLSGQQPAGHAWPSPHGRG